MRLSFVPRRMNEIVYGGKQFRNYRKLSTSIIDKTELYECFKKRFDEKELYFYFNFVDCFYLNY